MGFFWVFLLLSLSISDGNPLKPPLSDEPSNRLLESDLPDLPECQRSCSSDLAETYGILLKMGGTHKERYETVCQKFITTRECVSHCPDPMHLFDTLTSGIAYMCNEQYEAFNATIDCVDASSGEVQRECDEECNTPAVMFKWFMEGMSRMSDHGAGMGAHGGGGGLLDLFTGLGGTRADEEEERKEEGEESSSPVPVSVGRIKRDTAKQEPRAVLDDHLLSFLDGDKSIAATGTKANAVLDTVQRSIDAFIQPKSSLYPSSNLPSGKASGHSPFPSLGGHSEMGNPLDLSTMRDFASDACDVSECFLKCVKRKMNSRCKGSAGSLISEVFIRPLVRAQENLSSIPLAGSFFGFLLPPQCRFLHDTNKMAEHRIKSDIDEDLKRQYREEKAKLDAESVMPTALAEHISPFDSDENLDELIAHLYNGEGSANIPVDAPVDTVIYSGPIGKSDRSMDYDGSGEGSGEGSGSGMEVEEGSGEDKTFVFEFDAPFGGELQCVRV